jgi:hypothetical protein
MAVDGCGKLTDEEREALLRRLAVSSAAVAAALAAPLRHATVMEVKKK